LCFARNSFVVTALWAGALSWCRIQLLECHFSGRCLHTAPRRRCRTVLWNSLLTSATSLIVRRQSARMISRTDATVSLVWEVDSLSGWGSSSKDWRPLLKREYHSIVFDQLRQDSPKAACSISYVSAPDFPRRKQKSMHTRCCTLSSIVRCNAHWR